MFFDALIFETIYLLKLCPIFDNLLGQFTEYNNFLMVYWGFFCQKPFLFASLFWKRENPYYHNRRIQLYVPTYLAATSAQSLIQHYIQYRVGYTETKGLERRR